MCSAIWCDTLTGKDFAEAVLSTLWLSAAAVAEAEVTKLDSCTACSCFEAAEPETVYEQDVLEALFCLPKS